MSKTTIEWCDFSINPLRARYAPTDGDGHYCEKTSPGCAHCYSSRVQPRFGMPVFAEQRRATVEHYLDEKKLQQVLTRKKPTRYFWCDMTDIFGSWVPDEHLDRLFAVMALTPQHTHLVLTKRAERMRAYLTAASEPWGDRRSGIESAMYEFGGDEDARTITNDGWPLPNVWLGVSVENQHFADERIPLLLKTPAAIRFISAEPLLGPVSLTWESKVGVGQLSYFTRRKQPHIVNWPGLDWVIVGGESSNKARPCCVSWIRNIVHDCHDVGIACFVKQLGAKAYEQTARAGLGDHPDWEFDHYLDLKHPKGGDIAEWEPYLRVRQFPEEPL